LYCTAESPEQSGSCPRSRYLDGASGSGNIGDFVNSSNNVDMQAHYAF
jgi:hypothetical protein